MMHVGGNFCVNRPLGRIEFSYLIGREWIYAGNCASIERDIWNYVNYYIECGGENHSKNDKDSVI